MSGINAAIEVGKYSLNIALDSDGGLVSEPKESRGITRLAKRLAELGCTRVLIGGGAYQNVLVAALRGAGLLVVIINRRRVREFAKSIGPRPTASTRRCWRFMASGLGRQREPPNEQNYKVP